MNTVSLLRLMARRSLSQMMVYRLSATFVVIFGSLFAVAEVVSLLIFYQYTPDIAGWDFYAFLALIATYGFIQHIYQFFFVLSHEELMDKIIEGELDYDLIRPVDSQVLCSLRNLDYPSLINLIVPTSLLIYCWPHLKLEFTLSTLLAYTILLICGVALYYLLTQFFVCMAFWVDRPRKLAGVTEYLFDLASRPRAVYPRAMQLFLTFVLPVLTAVNTPVDLLRGEFNTTGFLALLGFLLVIVIIVRIQWVLGTRRYSSAS